MSAEKTIFLLQLMLLPTMPKAIGKQAHRRVAVNRMEGYGRFAAEFGTLIPNAVCCPIPNCQGVGEFTFASASAGGHIV